jgi:peptide/nickel transport system permease protein
LRRFILDTIKYIIKRILQTIPLLIIVSFVSFFIIRLSPVDPLAELKLNPSVSPETVEKETQRSEEN